MFWLLAKGIKLKFGSAREGSVQCSVDFGGRCKPSKERVSVPPPLRTQGHGQSHCASLEWVIRFVVAVGRHDICVDNCGWGGRGPWKIIAQGHYFVLRDENTTRYSLRMAGIS